MAINLTKGQNVKLDKEAKSVKIGLGWDANDSSGANFDLDAIAIALTDKNGKAVSDDHVVFYGSQTKDGGKPCDPEHAIIHSGDNLTGDGDGDDETITVNFNKLSDKVQAIVFVVNIYQASSRNQNFGMVRNARARLYFNNNSEADLVYDLEEDFSTETTLEFVMLYKHNDEWKFKALGNGSNTSLSEIFKKYGVPTSGQA